jgi:hypothetical protein
MNRAKASVRKRCNNTLCKGGAVVEMQRSFLWHFFVQIHILDKKQ